jgi:hypothetical protein
MPSATASTMNVPLVGQSFWPRCLAPASGRARLSFVERGTFALHAQTAVPSSALAIEHAGPVAPRERGGYCIAEEERRGRTLVGFGHMNRTALEKAFSDHVQKWICKRQNKSIYKPTPPHRNYLYHTS